MQHQILPRRHGICTQPSASPTARAKAFTVFCGDKSSAKAVRKRLERKRTDIEDATAALRVIPDDASRATISAMASNLQRLSLETYLLLNQAAHCLTEMDKEAAREEAAQEEQRKAFEANDAASGEHLIAAEASASQQTYDLQMEDESKPSPSTELNGFPAESLQANPSIESDLSAAEAQNGEPLLPVAAQLPEDGRIWSEARSALGEAERARVTVCQGKSCNRAGGLELLKEVEGIANGNAAVAVTTSKCLDKCKQGPCLQIDTGTGVATTCVSKDKPPKKAKKLDVGNNIVSKGALSRDASLV